MRVLVAPDKFKGTLSARDAAEAMAAGVHRAVPEAQTEVIPMADGGEGTLNALADALGGERIFERVQGPLGDPVEAPYALIPEPEGALAVVEMATASGLALVPERRRDPTRTTTFGTGQLILAACRAGARRVIVCIGGSATNDGGAGMAQAAGVRLLDAEGRDLPPGGAALLRLARIDLSELDPSVKAATVTIATDVDNPFVGPLGASVVYGPQKGATPADVALLDQALRHFAAVIRRDVGVDVREVPGAGAAGGLGGGLVAFLGGRMKPGIDVVMEAVKLRERMEGAALALTGEGSTDEQSLHGKAVSGVLRAAEEMRVPAVVLSGRVSVDIPGARVVSLVERFGKEGAMTRARQSLEEAAFEVTRDALAGEGHGQGR